MDYGKRPWWHWLIIYLVVGGLIYAGIYYFVIAKRGDYSYNTSNPVENTSPYTY